MIIKRAKEIPSNPVKLCEKLVIPWKKEYSAWEITEEPGGDVTISVPDNTPQEIKDSIAKLFDPLGTMKAEVDALKNKVIAIELKIK